MFHYGIPFAENTRGGVRWGPGQGSWGVLEVWEVALKGLPKLFRKPSLMESTTYEDWKSRFLGWAVVGSSPLPTLHVVESQGSSVGWKSKLEPL